MYKNTKNSKENCTYVQMYIHNTYYNIYFKQNSRKYGGGRVTSRKWNVTGVRQSQPLSPKLFNS